MPCCYPITPSTATSHRNPPEAQVGAATCRTLGAKVAMVAATNPRLAQSRALVRDGSRTETHWSGRVGLTRVPLGQAAQHFCRGRQGGREARGGGRWGQLGTMDQARACLPRPPRQRQRPTHQDGASNQAHNHRHRHRVCARGDAGAVAASARQPGLQVLVAGRAAVGCHIDERGPASSVFSWSANNHQG